MQVNGCTVEDALTVGEISNCDPCVSATPIFTIVNCKQHLRFNLAHGVRLGESVELVQLVVRSMRLAGAIFSNGDETTLASDYQDRQRHRNEARLIYDMILKGEIPNPGEETMKQLQDQISGIELRGV